MIYDLLFATRAFASSAAGEHHGPSIHEIWFPLANFLIYAFILVRFALPAVRGFLQSRRQQVVATIEDAATKKQQAEAFVKDYRARLAGLEKEAAAVSLASRQDGEMLKNKLVEEARIMAGKIKEDARLLANQEFNVARQKLLEEMAERAEAAARALARRNLSTGDHGRLVEEFMLTIGQTR